MMFFDAVGVSIHNLGISIFAVVVCSRLAALLNAPLTSNDFNRQSQISSVDAGLRNGSKMAGVVANFPNNSKRVFEKLWLMYQIFFTPP